MYTLSSIHTAVSLKRLQLRQVGVLGALPNTALNHKYYGVISDEPHGGVKLVAYSESDSDEDKQKNSESRKSHASSRNSKRKCQILHMMPNKMFY